MTEKFSVQTRADLEDLTHI